jgi:hypothetical protein
MPDAALGARKAKAVPMPVAAAVPVQPVRVASVTADTLVASAPKTPAVSTMSTAKSTVGLPLPSNIPPQQSTFWVAPKPAPAVAVVQPVGTQPQAVSAAARVVRVQSASLPVSRTVLPVNPSAAQSPVSVPPAAMSTPNWAPTHYQPAVVRAAARSTPQLAPVQPAGAFSSNWSQTSYQAAATRASTLLAPRSVSGVWQLPSVVVVDYSGRNAALTQVAQPFLAPVAQPAGYGQQIGPVTIDYSVLQ